MSPVLLLFVVLAAVNVEAAQTCSKNLDLLIIVDGSKTVCKGKETCPEWDAILQFSIDIVNSLTIGQKATQVAFATISDTIKIEWDLHKFTDKESVTSAIRNVKYPGGEFVDVLSALKIIVDVFLPVLGDRLTVQNIGILITDGAPKQPEWLYAVESLAVQLDRTGVFVVCDRPGCTESCAHGIASSPKKANGTYFLIDDYLKIDDVRDTLVKNICAYQTLDQAVLGGLGGSGI